jgi:transposase
MGSMTPKEKTDWKVERRKRAWALYETGWQQNEIAEALGVTRGAVSQWIKRAQGGGVEALDTPPRTGRPVRLSQADRRRLVKMLAKGAEAFGFRGEVWTNPRVAKLIQRELGVRYHPAHVSRILKELGWTPQKPLVQAKQRKPEEIERGWQERWPELKKRPAKKGETSSS